VGEHGVSSIVAMALVTALFMRAVIENLALPWTMAATTS